MTPGGVPQRPRGRGRDGRGTAVWGAGAGLAVLALVAACQGPAPSQHPEATIAFGSTLSATDRPSSVALATATAPASAVGPATTIDVDAGLLGQLPVAIDGVPLTADPETAAEIAADPGLRASVRSVAVAHAFGPVTSAAASEPTAPGSSGDFGSAGDYVVATVVRLRPGVFDAPFFRAWRDSFDQGVCAEAGGVAGHAEASIAGRTVSIGSCAGGVHTYHVHLPAREVLVSMQALGPGRYGELVAAGLRE